MSDVNYNVTATAPAQFGWEITPDDDNDLVRITREVTTASDGVVKWHNPAGELQTTSFFAGLPRAIKARRILETGTTATGIEALA